MSTSVFTLPRYSDDQINYLLPVLPTLGAFVREYGMPEEKHLRSMLNVIENSHLYEEWAVGEIRRWARVLNEVRGVQDPGLKFIAIRHLMERGIPEMPAGMALETIMQDTIVVSGDAQFVPPASSRLRVTPHSIGLGTLPAGAPAKATLRVEGGPGRVYCAYHKALISPTEFDSSSTEITVVVEGVSGGSVLYSSLVFEADGECLHVDMIGRWTDPSILDEEKRQEELKKDLRPGKHWRKVEVINPGKGKGGHNGFERPDPYLAERPENQSGGSQDKKPEERNEPERASPFTLNKDYRNRPPRPNQ